MTSEILYMAGVSIAPSQEVLNARCSAAFGSLEYHIFIITVTTKTPVWICEKAEAVYLSYIFFDSRHETREEEGHVMSITLN